MISGWSAAALLAAVTAPAAAQEVRNFSARGENGRPIRAEVLITGAGARPGGYGYLTIDLQNGGASAHGIDLSISGGYYRSSLEVTRSLRLEPKQRSRVVMPVPSVADRYATLYVGIDRERPNNAGQVATTSQQFGMSALLIGDRAESEIGWEAMLKSRVAKYPAGGRSRPELSVMHRRDASQLPPTWQLLTGFDLVVVDGRTANLDAERQDLICGYLRAGGSVLLTFSDGLADGPLKRAIGRGGADSSREGRHDFGAWFAVGTGPSARLPGGPLPRDIDRQLDNWFGGPTHGVLTCLGRAVAGPLPSSFYETEAVPGVGEVSLRLFFLFIVAFAAVVGPVNYLYWRRRRRLSMLLWTVPALGFVFTLFLLGWGLLSEGLGVRSTNRSITLLDQSAHQAVSWCSRTFYAGLSPGELSPDQSTYLFSMNPLGGRYDTAHLFQIEQGEQTRYGAGMLPSRHPTCFGTVSQGTRRERIRFQRNGDGDVALLSGPELQPVVGQHSVVLRDFDGVYFVGDGTSRMTRIAGNEVDQIVSSILAEWDDFVPPTWDNMRYARYRYGRSGRRERDLTGEPWFAELFGAELPRGAYLARVATVPGLDLLGLEVDYVKRRHLVLGRLAKEDFVE